MTGQPAGCAEAAATHQVVSSTGKGQLVARWQAVTVNESVLPRIEGSVSVAPGRRLGFAEFGPPDGRPVVWLHGTPGARRQIPVEARAFADKNGLRIVGIDRPGIGSSTPHLYDSILGFTTDLGRLADALGIQELMVIGLSGGGPYALAAGYAMPDRVRAVGILGGVAPTVGPDAIDGGLVSVASHVRSVLSAGRVPIGYALAGALRVARPLASPALDLFARFSPEGDRLLLTRPEFKAMFLDDLLNGSRKQASAPLSDVLLFTCDWGFRIEEVSVPVRWWHGDADNIVPLAHGQHVVASLPNAQLITQAGQSHLGGMGAAEEILATLKALWPVVAR